MKIGFEAREKEGKKKIYFLLGCDHWQDEMVGNIVLKVYMWDMQKLRNNPET